MADDVEKQVESQSESSTSATEVLVKEAESGKADLVDQQKASMDALKQGARSGVSAEFGKPVIEGSTENRSYLAKAGDQSFDVGRQDRVAPENALDENGRVTEFRLPDGRRVKVDYDDKGNPSRVVNGGYVIEKQGGKWVDVESGKQALEYVSVDKDGSVTMRGGGKRDYILRSDGNYQVKDYTTNVVVEEYKPDGTAYKRTVDKSSYKLGEETTYDPKSHIAETKYKPGTSDEKIVGYEVRNDQNQVTEISTRANSGAIVKHGDTTESFESCTKDGGNLMLTAADKSTLEIKQDGTWIRRDKAGKVSQITNSDGEVTSFERKGGKVTATVTDVQGKVVESKKAVEKLDDKDGSYTVALDKDHKVKRLADGTEEALDGKGARVESRADKLISKLPELSDQQKKEMQQDLADIDKLPPDQRDRIYANLERIAARDPADPMMLTEEQSREIATSLAHQIAHPETIKQGSKGTCAFASTEQMMATQRPADYADMVTKLACEGEMYTNSGRYIEVQGRENFMHDGKTDGGAQRSYTSELFQNAAAQLNVEPPKEYRSYSPWDERIHPRPEGVTPATDTGERIIDPTNPEAPPERAHGVETAEKNAEIMSELIPNTDYQARDIKDTADLEKAWNDNGGKPMSIGVYTDQAKFLGMTDKDAGGGASHAVCITHYEKGPPAMVYFDNTAGGEDHSWPKGKPVSAEEFVKAMQDSKSSHRHKAIVDRNSKTA